MSDESNDEREQGIDFQGLDDELESLDYPTTTEQLLEEYGDHELSLPNETTTLEAILQDAENEEFESAEEVRTTIFNFVGDEAVGTKGYSDRGGTVDEEESESF